MSLAGGPTRNLHYGAALTSGDARFSLQTCGKNPNGGPVAVDTFLPSALGLSDMHGNVM